MFPSEAASPQITILTPTWNRRHLLPRLYESLKAQKAKPTQFEWLVVDDGSTDGTSDWLATLIPDTLFPIRVIRQGNGGKHRALNRAAAELATPWVLIVDSDDWLLSGAIGRILRDTASAKHDILAIIAPLDIAGRPPRRFTLPGRTVNFAEWIDQTQVRDTSIIMRSNLLLDHPFPEFDGENFVAESSSFSRMFRHGGVWLSNEVTIQGAYLPGGLSSRSLSLRVRNPLGAIFTYNEHLKSNLSYRMNIRNKINYYRFFSHAKELGLNPTIYGFHVCLVGRMLGWIVMNIDLMYPSGKG